MEDLVINSLCLVQALQGRPALLAGETGFLSVRAVAAMSRASQQPTASLFLLIKSVSVKPRGESESRALPSCSSSHAARSRLLEGLPGAEQNAHSQQ